MRRIMMVATLVLLSSATAVHAQGISIYATSSNSRFSNVQTGALLTPSGPQNQYTNFWTSGIGGGVTFNIIPVGPVRVGLDLRGSTRPGTVGSDSAMAGIKVGFHPPLIRLKPYLQASGGYLATRTVNVSTGAPANSTFNNQYAAWEILGGIDVPIAPFLDFRAIELGGGTGVSVFGSPNAPNVSLFTVNSGLVVHF